MGRRLFLHGAQGYMPTVTGRALLERTERMEIAAAEIAQWQAAQDGPTRVRISAGTWSALHLAENIAQIWQPSAPWVPEFIHANIELDIARREIDIGVRNKRPVREFPTLQRPRSTYRELSSRGYRLERWRENR